MAVLLPSTALADANTTLQLDAGSWNPVLMTVGFDVPSLTQHIAIEIGAWPGDLATRHVVHEVGAVRGVAVTCRPGSYQGHVVPLLVV